MTRARTNDAVTLAVLATAALAFSLLQSLIIPAIPQLESAIAVAGRARGLGLTAGLSP